MSPRRYLIISAVIGGVPLVALAALDVTLDCLNVPEIPIRLHNVLLTLMGVVTVVGAVGVVIPLVYARGVEVGQRLKHLERASHRDGPTGEVVIPIHRRRPSPYPVERARETTM